MTIHVGNWYLAKQTFTINDGSRWGYKILKDDLVTIEKIDFKYITVKYRESGQTEIFKPSAFTKFFKEIE